MKTPTGWFLSKLLDGTPRAAARWYWPESTVVEMWNKSTDQWAEQPIFLKINDNSDGWENATETEVNAFIKQGQ